MMDSAQDGHQSGRAGQDDFFLHGCGQQLRFTADGGLKSSFRWNEQDNEIKRIDAFLLSQAHTNWRKVAMIVGITMLDMENPPKGVPDIFYSHRVKKLVKEGHLQSRGDLKRMRFSEVRVSSK